MPSNTAIRIAAKLNASGYQAWLVGGCVRDLVLGREPKDYDIATDAKPEELLRIFPKADLVGAQFGVVLVDGVEIATFRSDLNYQDGRHPEGVRFETDVFNDVQRRDFTINALLLPPQALHDLSQVVDHVGGLADLEAGLIRAIGDPERRFEEDHLRMVRAVRFAARFGFTIERRTLEAIQKLHSSILRIAPERIRDELIRILTEGGARRGFELLNESGLLSDILPEIAAMKGVAQPPEFHPEGDVWIHTLLMLEGLDKAPVRPSPALAMGVLLHDVGKPGTFRIADRIRFDGHVELGETLGGAILDRLRFSNEDRDQVLALIGNHMRFAAVGKMRESTRRRFLRLPHFEEHLALHRLDCLSSFGDLTSYRLMKEQYERLEPEQLRPTPLLTGNDLIAAGYRPGPAFSKMLEAVEDAQLESRIGSKEEALALVKAMSGQLGG